MLTNACDSDSDRNGDSNEYGGYAVLKNKNIILSVDIGSSPEKKFSQNNKGFNNGKRSKSPKKPII